jgi:hypothetical protein
LSSKECRLREVGEAAGWGGRASKDPVVAQSRPQRPTGGCADIRRTPQQRGARRRSEAPAVRLENPSPYRRLCGWRTQVRTNARAACSPARRAVRHPERLAALGILALHTDWHGRSPICQGAVFSADGKGADGGCQRGRPSLTTANLETWREEYLSRLSTCQVAPKPVPCPKEPLPRL